VYAGGAAADVDAEVAEALAELTPGQDEPLDVVPEIVADIDTSDLEFSGDVEELPATEGLPLTEPARDAEPGEDAGGGGDHAQGDDQVNGEAQAYEPADAQGGQPGGERPVPADEPVLAADPPSLVASAPTESPTDFAIDSASRPRRRRGRVVAPAGPPRSIVHVEPVLAPPPDTSA
jgi:ribonuclease E